MTRPQKKNKRSGIRRFIRLILTVFLIILLIAAGGLGILTILEYRPADEEPAERIGWETADSSLKQLHKGESFRIVTWNIGYGALGDNADFFMDGGRMVNTADAARLQENMQGIRTTLTELSPDVVFLQEIDTDSARSHHQNEVRYLTGDRSDPTFLTGYRSAFACNFRVPFIPYPIPPIGKVHSGIFTSSAFPATDAVRVKLPSPFSWPVRIANLKRCLLVTRIPVADSDRELVLVNLHLEAYDDGEGKIMQTKLLTDFLLSEHAAGNYVIAGGDFNQHFSSVDISAYPDLPGTWKAGTLNVEDLGEGFTFHADNSAPSCRSLDRPLAEAPEKDPAHFQYYVIDGFIVSDNVVVESCETQDLGFRLADHNPVAARMRLE